MTQEEYEKGFVDYMTKNNGKDYEKCYNKEHIADMKADFLSGAKWRINSVWRDASVKPRHNRKILILNKNRNVAICRPRPRGWKYAVKVLGFVKWAYVEDLIP